MTKSYYVYILTNVTNRVLYIGVTGNLIKRVYEHKAKLVEGFTKIYNVNKLVYVSEFNDPSEAITYEKKLKGWIRRKKIDLIEKTNPEWKDLYQE